MQEKIQLNAVDKILRYVNPKAALERVRCRAALSGLENYGFISSGSSNRSMRSWNPVANTADQDIIPKLESLRASSRDLYMNTPLATGAIRRIKTNAIGFGLRLQCRIEREVLGLKDDKAEAWERRTEREFMSWANSPECDAARTLSFPQLTGLAFFSTMLSGDCFALIPRIPRQGQLYDLRIQIIEGDYVCNPYVQVDTNRVSGGIEVDDYGAPIAYHFRRTLLDGLAASAGGLDRWVRIPAYGSNTGRRQVFHLYDKERPGQRRGVPMLAPVIEELKQITRLSKAEIQAAIINSYFTVFVRSQNPVGNVLSQGYMPPGAFNAGAPGVSTLNSADSRDDVLYEMGSGNVIEMGEGEDISIADAKRPNVNFEPFFLAIVKQMGSALGIPYEELMLHFNSSYSASRAALQEAWKFYREKRLWAATYFCQPIYKEWLIEAILKKRIEAPGFFEDHLVQDAWCGAVWTGPSQGQLDPLKETKASILRIKNRLGTYEDEYVAITGYDWDGAMNRLSREEKHLDNLGISTELEAKEDSVSDRFEEAISE
jgi:lambda family phage portal protein